MKEKKAEKKITWLPTALGVLIVVAVIILLTVMIVTTSSPKQAVDGLLNNLREGDFEKAKEFLSGEDLLEEDEYNEEIKDLFFDKLSWKVVKVTEEKETANIEIEITNKDFKTIMGNYMAKVLKEALSGEQNQEKLENELMEELKNEETTTITSTQNMQAIKEGKKWKIVSNEQLINVLLPGFKEVTEAFN